MGLMSMTTAMSKCSPNNQCYGPLGRQCHCESQVYSQAVFHLMMNLLTGNDYDTGASLPAGNPAYTNPAAWFIYEHIFFNAVQLQASYGPAHTQTWGTGAYQAAVTVEVEPRVEGTCSRRHDIHTGCLAGNERRREGHAVLIIVLVGVVVHAEESKQGPYEDLPSLLGEVVHTEHLVGKGSHVPLLIRYLVQRYQERLDITHVDV